MELNDDWLSWPPETVEVFFQEFPCREPSKECNSQLLPVTIHKEELPHVLPPHTFL